LITFIARFIRAFKLRHMRFGLIFFIFNALDIQEINLLLNPWSRAAVYTRDRVGFVVAGETRIVFQAMSKLTVGPETAERYSVSNHVLQARFAQGGMFYTLIRWFSSMPHMSNRFVELVRFMRRNNAAISFIESDQKFYTDFIRAFEIAG